VKRIKGGTVKTADTRKNAPGKLSIVTLYTALYNGFPQRGVVESITAINELIFPISSIGEIFESIVLAAMIIVPLRTSTVGAAQK